MAAIPHNPDEEPIHMTEAEYLAFEDESEFKHEYRGGIVYDMTGGSLYHSIITANVSRALGNQLADRDYTVTSPDVRIHIAHTRTYRYPDVTVFCGEPAFFAGRTDTITNPVVLVEVLSPGTSAIDHRDKLQEYIRIDTLQAYLLVAQHEPHVQRYLRQDSGQWLYTSASSLDAEIALPPINCTLTLSSIYQKVSFEPPASDAGEES